MKIRFQNCCNFKVHEHGTACSIDCLLGFFVGFLQCSILCLPSLLGLFPELRTMMDLLSKLLRGVVQQFYETQAVVGCSQLPPASSAFSSHLRPSFPFSSIRRRRN